MKLKVKKRNIDAALQVATLAIGSGEDGVLAAHYLIRYNIKTGITTVLAQDGRRLLAEAPILECTVETDVTGDFDAFTVPGWRLRLFLSAVEDPEEEISLTSSADGSLKGAAKRGTGKFGSLNPKDFPYWDTTYDEAKLVGTLPAEQLTNILSYAKSFVSDQETRSPGLAATECRDGVLSATDSVGVAIVTSDALKNSTLRIHGKDIPSLLSFLGIDSDPVEIREHDRCLFLRRADGRMIGATRWIHQFPQIAGMNPDPNKQSKGTFTINTVDFTKAVKYLAAFAKKDDNDIHFRFDDGNIILSMRSGSGSQDDDEQVIPCSEHAGMESFKADGIEGFRLSKRYVEAVAQAFDQDTMQFRVDVTKKNGYVSFFHNRDGDSYYTVIVWLKNK